LKALCKKYLSQFLDERKGDLADPPRQHAPLPERRLTCV
jgi:hypothetical protein